MPTGIATGHFKFVPVQNLRFSQLHIPDSVYHLVLVVNFLELRPLWINPHVTSEIWMVQWRSVSLLCPSLVNRLYRSSTIYLQVLRSIHSLNPLSPELNPICYLLALLWAHYFLHVSRIRVKSLTLRRLMSYTYGAPILDVSRSHTTTQHSR